MIKNNTLKKFITKKSVTNTYIFLFALSTLLFSTSSCHSDDPLTSSIKLSADYINNFSKPDGMFDYEVDIITGRKSDRNYNILRHSGTIYALASYYMVYKNNQSLETLRKATQYLKDCCVKPVDGKTDILAVWSLKSINKSMNYDQLKLGGTGLGLVALLSMEKINPGTTDIETLRKLGEFILFMQKDDGSFYSKYVPSTVGRDDRWTSLYYPGEAALGLVMLYEYDPQPKWFNNAVKVLTYLANLRKNDKKVPPDHWALLATAKILEISKNQNLQIPEELIINHGKQVINGIIAGVPAYTEKTNPNFGCLTRNGRTTPTATRLEGIIAFYKVLGEKDMILNATIARVSANGINFLMRSQIKDGLYKGAIPPRYVENFEVIKPSRNNTIIRIDYVQHALSAFLDYQKVFGK